MCKKVKFNYVTNDIWREIKQILGTRVKMNL
jgi:hypothetical protein